MALSTSERSLHALMIYTAVTVTRNGRAYAQTRLLPPKAHACGGRAYTHWWWLDIATNLPRADSYSDSLSLAGLVHARALARRRILTSQTSISFYAAERLAGLSRGARDTVL